jgi:hypothetical protein
VYIRIVYPRLFHVEQSRASQAITQPPQENRIFNMAKLTRSQIKEGLEQIPMESLLQGASGTEVNLTARQIEFAKQLALGKGTKVGAYRKAYGANGSPKSVGSRASTLSTDQRIQVAVESFRALEAYKEYQTPAQLRALVVSQLTNHVLDPDFPPAQRVQCLKLLGSVAEIGLFVDRKETLVVHQSADIRERLLSQLKGVINTQAIDVTPNDDADSLMSELARPTPNEANEDDATPTHSPPPDEACDHPAVHIHTIPHESSATKSIPHESPSQNSIPHESSVPESIPHDEYPHGEETKQSLDNK